MTNPKQAPDAQRHICDKPGCGMEMVNLRAYDYGLGEALASDASRTLKFCCPRTDSEHRLCAQLAEARAALEKRLAERGYKSAMRRGAVAYQSRNQRQRTPIPFRDILISLVEPR